MIGVAAHPSRTLSDRVLERLGIGPQTSAALCDDVLGLAGAPIAVADRIAVALLGPDPRVRQLPDGRWSLVAEVQGSPLLDDCAFAVVDVETTGSRAGGGDRVTEVAVVVVQGPRLEMVLDSLVDPGRPIPAAVTMVTGITDAMVRSAPPFAEVAEPVLAALAGRVFVAHNARFDWGFVTAEVRRARALAMSGSRVCTVRLARRLLPDLPSRSLDSLSHHFALENPARHRAGGDAHVTAQLLERLLRLAREQGVRTLAELEELSRRSIRRGERGPGTWQRETASGEPATGSGTGA